MLDKMLFAYLLFFLAIYLYIGATLLTYQVDKLLRSKAIDFEGAFAFSCRHLYDIRYNRYSSKWSFFKTIIWITALMLPMCLYFSLFKAKYRYKLLPYRLMYDTNNFTSLLDEGYVGTTRITLMGHQYAVLCKESGGSLETTSRG